MRVLTALRSEKMDILSVGGPGWQVLEYSVGKKLEEGLPPLLARRWMSGDGRQC